MFKNYLKIALRQLWIHKIHSIINIAGLSIGLSASFIILLYILYQVSYDKHNELLDDISLITAESKTAGWTDPRTPIILSSSMKSEFPEVKEAARWVFGRCSIKYGDKNFDERRCVYSDADIFKILSMPFKYGDLNSIMKERNFVVINESMQEKYFGNRNPIGEILSFQVGKEKYDLKVCAVMKDIPKTSTFYTYFIAPWYIEEKRTVDYWKNYSQDPSTSWDIQSAITYILLSPAANKAEFEKKLTDLSNRHLNQGFKTYYHSFPLKDLYFHSAEMVNNRFPSGSLTNVYIYTSAAFLILFIACVNYLMLSLGRASLRTKEVGIRKVIGAVKFDLFKQIIVEAILISLIALPIAITIVQFFLPDLSQLLGVKITSNYFYNWKYILYFTSITVLIGIIAGSYIAFYLSGLNPIDIIKNKTGKGAKKIIFRRILIATQMVIFVGLIFSSLTIYKQMNYFINKDFGFNKEQLVVLYPKNRRIGEKFEVFKNELKSNTEIINVSASIDLPGTANKGMQIVQRKDDPSQGIAVEWLHVDKDFIETMEMNILMGRGLQNAIPPDPEDPTKGAGDCVINEAAVREFGLKNPIGDNISGTRIIGVVKDFNMHSLHERIAPLVISVSNKYLSEIAVRVKPGNIPNTLKYIQEKSKQFNGGEAMQTSFYDERLNELYENEQKFSIVINYAAGIAIFVACLGLFGISLFVSQQRVKEIGIRKVLGASIRNIYTMMTKEFIILAGCSSLIAFPIAWYFIGKWLQNFEYRVNIDIWIFILSAIIGIVIVVFTVSIRAIQSALANPVKSIKYE
jgi:putative ABC transport system permease protein